MDPAILFGDVDPANNFTMNGLPMHFVHILIADGHTLPPHLFMDVLTEKSEILKEYIQIQHVGLCLTANIRAQSAAIRIYDTYTANINLLLRFTITNALDLENCLFELYEEVHALVDIHLPEEDDDMPYWRMYQIIFDLLYIVLLICECVYIYLSLLL